jgi:hypothetical protein
MRISINSSKKKQDSTIKAFRFACLEGREGGREGGRERNCRYERKMKTTARQR